ncbi:MAG TPA: decaprenyl-phosphate phosphoribosyltransferase [Acidimicrobiales bacterium]
MCRHEASSRAVAEDVPVAADVGWSEPAGTGPPQGWRATLPGGLLRTARPKQWMKNVLVFAAPAAAGVLGQARPLARTVLVFVVFCLVASGTYFLNDCFDVSGDRCHPTKRFRPIAAGVVGVGLAEVVGTALIASGLGLSVALGWRTVVVVASYLAVQALYTLWLKHEVILDLAAVAAGFVLRAIAGGVAVGVPISEWFLIVAMFGSLFMVAGRRMSELRSVGDGQASSRATLALYTAPFLRFILLMSSTVTVTAYCLWAFESEKAVKGGIWFQLSIVPFTLALLRYAFLLDQGQGGSPEDVVLGDRSLQVLAVLWMLIIGVGIYG